MSFFIIATTPQGGAWARTDDKWRVVRYENREIAESVCTRLNKLDVPYTYVVRERKS